MNQKLLSAWKFLAPCITVICISPIPLVLTFVWLKFQPDLGMGGAAALAIAGMMSLVIAGTACLILAIQIFGLAFQRIWNLRKQNSN
jgi:hypothetical protein